MTKVKICGVQKTADAVAAAQEGADFIGLVFVPGRRRALGADNARRLISQLHEQTGANPRTVGLFADQPIEEVGQVVRHCGLDMVQLCGEESLGYCDRVEVPVIKVLHVSNSLAVEDAVPLLAQEMDALMQRGHLITLDRQVEGLQGGTGRSFNWEIARALAEQEFSFLLAGGLTPENVGMAVRTARPWGVDVSSGVETGGAKDQRKIQAFIHAVLGASQQHIPLEKTSQSA